MLGHPSMSEAYCISECTFVECKAVCLNWEVSQLDAPFSLPNSFALSRCFGSCMLLASSICIHLFFFLASDIIGFCSN